MISIGGLKQGIMINGKNRNNPVLVFLHGGPGFPMLPFEPNSRSMKRLERHYTIVYWEQRGTGISYHPGMNADSMNIKRFVNDTHELNEYARKLFNE
jgi:pimeloyl-ACP methyl ester carboxylesterase